MILSNLSNAYNWTKITSFWKKKNYILTGTHTVYTIDQNKCGIKFYNFGFRIFNINLILKYKLTVAVNNQIYNREAPEKMHAKKHVS